MTPLETCSSTKGRRIYDDVSLKGMEDRATFEIEKLNLKVHHLRTDIDRHIEACEKEIAVVNKKVTFIIFAILLQVFGLDLGGVLTTGLKVLL